MNIVYTFDDGYSTITAVSMLSLLENNKEEKIVNIYIVDCGISIENRNKFIKMANRFGRKIVFVNAKDMEKRIPIKLELSYWSFVCYVRLFFSDLLPHLDKVMHIDCDTLVLGRIGEIYNVNLKENLCAGCYDCVPTTKYMAGFSEKMKYFSNGFLIFDLKRMRDENIQEKFIKYIVEKNGILPHLDQDVVNAVLKDKILTLPPEYNFMTYSALFGKKTVEFFNSDEPYYTVSQMNKAVSNPIVIHLVGYRFVSRPWGQPCYHPYNKEWIKYYDVVDIEFQDGRKLLKKRKKKYGLLREIVCVIWNLGYKIPFIRNMEFLQEKKRVQKKCSLYLQMIKSKPVLRKVNSI